MYEQNEIVLIPFPYTDLTSYKNRPALIISNKLLNKSEDRICCLITSVPSKDGIEIDSRFIEEGELQFKSWVKSYRIFTINKKIIKKKICKVSKEFHDFVICEINNYLKKDN